MNLSILFASAEVVPFSKTGGLADVAGALPKEIGKTNDVTVITPLYKGIDLSVYNPKEVGRRQIHMGSISTTAVFEEISLNNIKYVFVSNGYYERDNFYGYQDDNVRFMLFNFAILEYLVLTDKKVDIIHVNDWQAALVPYLLDTTYRHLPKFRDIKTLLSIHNLQYQGSFDKESFVLTNKPFDYTCIHFDRFNFLKTGIMTADFINTVSETYKNEIQTEYFGNTLDGALRSRKQDLYGILNGIDYSIYNPETDPHIPFKYNKNRFVSGKRENKTQLLKELKLDNITSIPLVGHIGRLATQKGIDLMMATLEEAITASNANYVFLGSGEEKYEKFLESLMHKYPHRVYTYVGFSHALAQKIYAASDLLIMPSLFEPCGLSQMIAMRYGTLPVVRETGGLKDTVIPYNKYTNEGNGFSFANYNAHEFKDALLTGIHLYNNNQHVFRLLQTQAMNSDFSLSEMGKNYLALYKKLLRK